MSFGIGEEQKAQYRTEGYFVLESVVPPAHLALLQEQCASAVRGIDEQMDREGTDSLGINHRGRRYFVGQSWRIHPRLGAFLFSELMAAICRATLGDAAFLHNDQYVVKCEKAGMSFAWHQDSAYTHARIGDHPEYVTCWCALDDVNEDNGTVYLLPASRFGKRELAEHRQDPETKDRIGYTGNDPGDPVIVPAGSMAVFSSLVFHRSGANPSGKQRRAYLAQYVPEPIRNLPGEFPQYYAEPFLEGGRVVRSG
jgi:ectoine hydroxylase-related dioxygenase (phytanoyl-CoA dioxygenase family)